MNLPTPRRFATKEEAQSYIVLVGNHPLWKLELWEGDDYVTGEYSCYEVRFTRRS